MAIISIKGLDKAEVLAAFYNASRPMGMGMLQARPGEMTKEEAEKVLTQGDDVSRMFGRAPTLSFDYLYGRPLKIDLSKDMLDTSLFDRDNGECAGVKVIAALRAKEGK